MSYVNGLKFQQRRHPVKQLTGPEAIAELNRIVDQANARVAKAMGQARHFEGLAMEMAAENEQLKNDLARAERETARLREQLEKLRRLRKTKKQRWPEEE